MPNHLLSFPSLYHIIKGLFGIEIPFLSIMPTFGLIMACSFVAAAYILTRELKRKEAAGLMPGTKENIKGTGKSELIMPHQRVMEFVWRAFIGGIIGAKVFDALEDLKGFAKDPFGTLFSRGGLTFYGGLIVAAIVIILYARKKRINIRHLVDSFAPALMLAYAIGRLGCQFSGDGDWGIYNTAYGVYGEGNIQKMAPGEFNKIVNRDQWFFSKRYDSISNIPHTYFAKPNSLQFLPDWLFAQAYPHNVVNDGVPMADCTEEEYCRVLPIGVFPTPVYESIACFLLFAVLWAIRKRINIPGVLFGIYLVMNGMERFFVEKIRVNAKYSILGFHPTQAELISAALAIGGLVFIGYCYRQKT